MSWAHGVLPSGKEIGYGVVATCEQEGCEAQIDRGLAYVCGGMHEGAEHGCGGYFCDQHLYHEWGGLADDGEPHLSPQLCRACCERFESRGASR